MSFNSCLCLFVVAFIALSVAFAATLAVAFIPAFTVAFVALVTLCPVAFKIAFALRDNPPAFVIPTFDNLPSSLPAVAGFVTSGGSVAENLVAKTAVKVGAAVINNTVEINTTTGVTVHKNVGNIIKNTAIDLAADKIAGQ